MKMTKYLVGMASLMMLLISCTTIEISEKDAFDVKRTVYPEDFEDTPYTLTHRKIRSDSLALDAWWLSSPDARGTVLYFGGNGFVKEIGYHIIFSILGQDMNLLVFNYRGYGRNPGKPSIAGLKADGIAAYHHVRDSLNITPEELIIHGHSVGTFVATYVAARKDLAGLVLQSPITNAEDMTDALVPNILKPLVNFEIAQVLQQENNLEEIQAVSEPLLVTCGTDDNITPKAMAKSLHDHAPMEEKKLKLIKGGSHNNLDENPTYQKHIRRFYHQNTQPSNQ